MILDTCRPCKRKMQVRMRSCEHVVSFAAGAKSAKGLHVCRHLHRAGWRVILVDTHK